jgi:hypothetical protein
MSDEAARPRNLNIPTRLTHQPRPPPPTSTPSKSEKKRRKKKARKKTVTPTGQNCSSVSEGPVDPRRQRTAKEAVNDPIHDTGDEWSLRNRLKNQPIEERKQEYRLPQNFVRYSWNEED